MTMNMDYRCDHGFRRILCRAPRQRSVLHPSSIACVFGARETGLRYDYSSANGWTKKSRRARNSSQIESKVVDISMQVRGIANSHVSPLERIYRDVHLRQSRRVPVIFYRSSRRLPQAFLKRSQMQDTRKCLIDAPKKRHLLYLVRAI